MASRMRFSAGSLAALGLTPDDVQGGGGDIAARLGFGPGVKVTSAKADGDDVVLNLSGATLADGTAASGEVTGSFGVNQGRATFGGFVPVGDAEPEPAEATGTGQEG